MGTRVTVTEETGYSRYPVAEATFDGTQTARFWHDPTFRKSLVEAIKLAGEDKDIFDFCNFLFSHVNNAVRRRYGGQEIVLYSVTVSSPDSKITAYQ